MVYLSCITKQQVPTPSLVVPYNPSSTLAENSAHTMQMDRERRRQQACRRLEGLQSDFYSSLLRQQAEQCAVMAGGGDGIPYKSTNVHTNFNFCSGTNTNLTPPPDASSYTTSIAQGHSSTCGSAQGSSSTSPVPGAVFHPQSSGTNASDFQELYKNHLNVISAIQAVNGATPSDHQTNTQPVLLSASLNTSTDNHEIDSQENNFSEQDDLDHVPLESNRLLKSPVISSSGPNNILLDHASYLPDLLSGFESALPQHETYDNHETAAYMNGAGPNEIMSLPLSMSCKFSHSFDELHQYLGKGFPAASYQIDESAQSENHQSGPATDALQKHHQMNQDKNDTHANHFQQREHINNLDWNTNPQMHSSTPNVEQSSNTNSYAIFAQLSVQAVSKHSAYSSGGNYYMSPYMNNNNRTGCYVMTDTKYVNEQNKAKFSAQYPQRPSHNSAVVSGSERGSEEGTQSETGGSTSRYSSSNVNSSDEQSDGSFDGSRASSRKQKCPEQNRIRKKRSKQNEQAP